ncbi:MAG: hypothetical protein K2G63_04140 [Oscillospiraceae bacterium]|nr:hypothetical protein [Oscillospiraceae bacterium]
MKKINKLISTIFSISMLASISLPFATSAEETNYQVYGMPLERMTMIDKKGYTDEYLLSEDSIVFRFQWTLEDLENLDLPQDIKDKIDPFAFTLPEYYVCYEDYLKYDDEGVCRLSVTIDDIGLLFLTYVLDTEEKYNEMSEYLDKNYPDLELIKINMEGIANDDADIDKRLQSIVFLHENDIYMLKNVDDYLATSEEEMFEIAVQIQKDLGYDIPFICTQDVPRGCELVYGDANFDEELSIADVVALSAYIGNPKSNPICDFATIISDVHNRGDGITANDALMIQQYLAGMIDSLE